jgi:CRP-like cAMP-binding protein
LTLTIPKTRIASYILLLAAIEDSRSITLPVTRQELANLLDMTHETFYRTAEDLTNGGLVRLTGQSVGILDRDRLVEMTE